jgi:hypothetical protein
MSATVFCADCGCRKGLHRPEGQHPCALCECRRFVSHAEAEEILKSIREQLAQKEEVKR